MSKKKEDGDEKPKKSGKMKLLIGAVALLGLGAGGAYGAVAMGYIGAHAEVEDEPDVPQLVTKGEEDLYAAAGEGGEGDAAAAAGRDALAAG